MKIIKKIAIALLVVFVGIQFFPSKRNQSDSVLVSDFLQLYNAPKQIENIIKVSCYDCHSNNTNYEWYHKIQPIGWLLENHIKVGKEDLNFSTFGEYSNRRKKGKLKSIISQIKKDEMPLWSYTLLHSNAKLSEKDQIELQEWLLNLRDSL